MPSHLKLWRQPVEWVLFWPLFYHRGSWGTESLKDWASSFGRCWRSWSPDLGSLIPGLELLATVPQSEYSSSLVCHKEGGHCSHDFFPGYQSAIVLGGENLDWREEGERKGGQSQVLGPPGHLGGVSLHPCVDPLVSWSDDGPRPGTRAPVASAVATFVD